MFFFAGISATFKQLMEKKMKDLKGLVFIIPWVVLSTYWWIHFGGTIPRMPVANESLLESPTKHVIVLVVTVWYPVGDSWYPGFVCVHTHTYICMSLFCLFVVLVFSSRFGWWKAQPLKFEPFVLSSKPLKFLAAFRRFDQFECLNILEKWVGLSDQLSNVEIRIWHSMKC